MEDFNGTTMLVYGLGALVLLYALFELHYFLRMCLCAVSARFFKSRVHILDTTIVKALCFTTDIDTLLYHMNNARYLRELDFARVDFYERTNLYRSITKKGGSVFQGAATIRYRRFIRPFQLFSITSRILHWDSQSVFMEHRFVHPTTQFVHAIALCRQRVLDCSIEDIMNELLLPPQTTDLTVSTQNIENIENGDAAATNMSLENIIVTTSVDQVDNVHVESSQKKKPQAPPEVLKWIEYNELSSKILRNGQ